MLETGPGPEEKSFFNSDKTVRQRRIAMIRQFLLIAAMLVITTILNIFLEHLIHPSSLVFVYLVPAMAGAIAYGSWASVMSFTAGFLIFDFFFVEPYYSLHMSKPQDIYNITVYFIVAALLTYLIHRVHRQNAFLRGRLDRVSQFEDMSRDFMLLAPLEQGASGGPPTAALQARALGLLGQLALKYTKTIFDVPAIVFFRDENGGLKIWAKSSVDLEITKREMDAAAWTLGNGEVAGAGTYTLSDTPFYFIPLKSLENVIGVIGISYNSRDFFPEQRRLLGTIINLTTIVASIWMNLKTKQTQESVKG